MAMLSITAGGINASEIVAGLMQAERQPLTLIQDRQATVRLQITALKSVIADLGALRTQALAVTDGAFSKLTASSSASAATATAGTGAVSGSVTFSIDRIGQAHGLRTARTVATTTSPITSAAFLAISTSTAPLGIGQVHAGTGLGAGSFAVAVTQATRGAVRSGATAVATTTAVDASNDQLQIEIDGVAHDVALAHGTYSAADLATAVTGALAGHGAAASVDAAGRLVLTTAHEGSAASLRVSGGTALGTLGLAVDAAAATGSDGVISVTPPGGNASTVAVTSAAAGTAVAVDTGAGILDLTLAGPLRVGTSTVAVVATGDGSLASVAGAINAANVGVSAAAVRASDGAWLLQLGAGNVGSASAIAVDHAAFGGGLLTTSAAQDAAITIGSGPGAYTITGRGNQFADVLPGVVITTTTPGATPVTVTVAADHAAAADAVERLVAKANVLLAQVAAQTAYDPATTTAGPLNGERVVSRLATDVRAAITAIVPGATPPLGSSVGITTTRDGSVTFDRQKFLTALAADPTGVARLFGRGGSSTGGVTFAASTEGTVAGAYDIEITTAATRATTDVLAVAGNPDNDVVEVRRGSTAVSFTVAAGSSPEDVANGLRAALAEAGLSVDVLVEGGGIRLRAAEFGGAGGFEVAVASTDTGFESFTGTDVVGTIDGQAAIGVGNHLRLLDTSTSAARGLEITVDEGVAGPLELTYEPGIAVRIAALSARLTADSGSLTITNRGYEDRVDAYNAQVERFEDRLERVELNLVRQWSSVQTLLQSMENQSSWLASQIAGLPQMGAS